MTEPTDEDRLRAALSDPTCYARHPSAQGPVTVVETHISIVALVGDLVFKAKKPRKLPFLDFSTRELRRAICHEEVRLNRRLCPHVYLGTAELRRERDGALRLTEIDAPSAPADFECVVVMRRLPQDRMMDKLLAEHAVTRQQVEQLGRILARFHATADRGEATRKHGDPDRLVELAEANFRELPASNAPSILLDALRDAQRRGFDRIRSTLRARADRGFVVDGHGDLHARNLCMTDPPAIYDCLEFDAGLRCSDTATDLAFLAMDLRHRGAPGLCQALVEAYVDSSGDLELPSLLPTLVAYRAIVRAKVAALAAADAAISAADRLRASDSSTKHLLLAAMASIESDGPMWLVLCGPPGSGKSTLASTIADACGSSLVSTDVVRKRLAGLEPDERLPSTAYTSAANARTYEAVLDEARKATRIGAASVVLDGNFHSIGLRRQAADMASEMGARTLFVHVDVPATLGLARVTARMSDPARASDADPQMHDALRARFVPPSSAEGIVSVIVDGSQPPLEVAASTLALAIRALSS